MAQQLAADFNIDPDTTSGPELADLLNRFNSAMLTMRSGTSRPPSAEAGTTWLDTTSATDHIAYFYDGTTDIKMFTLKVSSNTIVFEDSYLTAKGTSFAISLDGSALANDDGTDNYNLGIGLNAGNDITSGVYNVYIGPNAGDKLTTGNSNVGVGWGAGGGDSGGHTGDDNVSIGVESGSNMTTAYENVFLGRYAGAYKSAALTALDTFYQCICLGSYSYATAAQQISIGNSSYITSAYVASAFSVRSDERYKDFQDMDLGLDFINAIDPRKFTWNSGADKTTINYGFSAQQVKAVLEEQVGDEKRYIHSIRGDEQNLAYTEFVAPLVKAVQELSTENQQLKNDYNSLLKRVTALENKEG